MNRASDLAVLATALTIGLASPARAQTEPQTIEQRLARILIQALAPTSYGDWGYRWDAVSIRISRDMHWHLPAPDPRSRPPGAEVRRTGWVEVTGAQIGVIAEGGDEGVKTLSFRIGRRSESDDDDSSLLNALSAQGGVMTAAQQDGRFASYDLTAPDRDRRRLTRSVSCTPPESRAARQCWADFTLTLGQ